MCSPAAGRASAGAARARGAGRGLRPAVLPRSLHARVVEDERHVVLVDGWRAARDGRVRVVVVVPRLARGRARRLQRDGLVVPQSSTALAALDDGHEALPVLLVKERVQDRIDARVGRAEPLRQRRHDREHVLLPLLDRAAELDPREDQV